MPEKFITMKTLITAFAVCIAFTSPAQNPLGPSKKSFEKKWISNRSYQMTWYAGNDSSKTEMGKVSTRILVGKKELTVVTDVQMKMMKTPWTDSTIASLKTLAPVRHASYNMQRDMVLNFGKVVTGYYNDKIKKRYSLISDTAGTGFFDSNLYPVLLGWLKLSDDFKQEISIYDYNPSAKMGVIKAFVKSVSSAAYQTEKNGTRKVWVVKVSDEIGKGENGNSTYYFDKKDRRLWKQDIETKGRRMMMKLVE